MGIHDEARLDQKFIALARLMTIHLNHFPSYEKHDLALELGCTVATLERSMSEREFRQWIAYASKRLLPTRRLEAYLAQVASVLAQTAGNSDLTLVDFLLDFKRKASC